MCPSVVKAISFYRAKTWANQDALGQPKTIAAGEVTGSCAYKHWVARLWQNRAEKARQEYAYHYNWWEWLPDKWQRIGACETGYGKRPGQWNFNSGAFQGAFGFANSTWDQYKPEGAPSEAYLATPRQQYQCALNVYAAHGYGAWGCGGA